MVNSLMVVGRLPTLNIEGLQTRGHKKIAEFDWA